MDESGQMRSNPNIAIITPDRYKQLLARPVCDIGPVTSLYYEVSS